MPDTGISPLRTGDVIREILSESVRQGLDPLAVLAVAQAEGGLTPAPGHFDPDQRGAPGWSYGPFQMRSPGALPIVSSGEQGPGAQYAWSREGIDYAVRQIGNVARGVRGQNAIRAIVTKFEQPANPESDYSRAFPFYERIASIYPPLVDRQGNIAPGAIDSIAEGGSYTGPSGSGDLGTALGGFKGAAGAYAAGASQAAGAVVKPLRSIGDLIEFLTSWRFAEIVGGMLLLIVGLILLGRSLGMNTPRLPGGAGRDLDRAFAEGVQQGEVARARSAGRASVTRTSTESSGSVRARRIRSGAADFGEVPF